VERKQHAGTRAAIYERKTRATHISGDRTFSHWGFYTDLVRRESLSKVLTIVGIIVVCIGLSVPFLGLYFLFDVFIPAIGIGVISAFVGLVMWSRRITRTRQRALSASLLFGGGLAYIVAIRNLHTWGLFFLIAIPAVLLGLVLLVMSAFTSDPDTVH
jgi:hypothetical protein